MKIIVNGEEHHIAIPLPNGIVFSPVVAAIGERAAKKSDVELPSGSLSRLFKEIRSFRRKYGKLCLIEVEEKNGDRVEIWI